MLYRSDGGRRLGGDEGASWISALWVVGASRAGSPARANNGGSGLHTSNILRFSGDHGARASLYVDRRVVFESDSQIVARQVLVFIRWRAACRSPICGRTFPRVSNSAALG